MFKYTCKKTSANGQKKTKTKHEVEGGIHKLSSPRLVQSTS